MPTTMDEMVAEANNLLRSCVGSLDAGIEPTGMVSVMTDGEARAVALLRFAGDTEADVWHCKRLTFTVLGGALAGADCVISVIPMWSSIIEAKDVDGAEFVPPAADPKAVSQLAVMVAALDEEDGQPFIGLRKMALPYGRRDDGSWWVGETEPMETTGGAQHDDLVRGVLTGPLDPVRAAILLAELGHVILLDPRPDPSAN